MTHSKGERQYRACQRCRQRKSRCDLSSVGETGKPPCAGCLRTGNHCTFADSKRGGNYTHLRKSKNRNRRTTSLLPLPVSGNTSNSPTSSRQCRAISVVSLESSSFEEEPICAELRNPFDALQILAKAAVNDGEHLCDNQSLPCSPVSSRDPMQHSNTTTGPIRSRERSLIDAQDSLEKESSSSGIFGYELVANGTLEPETVGSLLGYYKENYHPFVPIAPKHVFSPDRLDDVAIEEPFLLTAILTIASKSRPNLTAIHQNCWEYMRQLMLDVLLGMPSTLKVGSVEGLLILSDWVPYVQLEKGSRPRSNVGPGNAGVTEDNTAWSLVGQAVRQAYLLRLDRMSFRDHVRGESKEQIDRKRLVWTFVYVADRQISVRMGQSFWSRGPSLSTRLTASDFPSLQPSSDSEDDYASTLQATTELTQLLHNVHDILYSSSSRTMEMMVKGDYSRYLDDFLKALLAWHAIWNELEVSPKLKYSLRLMYEYLCLYVNAFSFQSVVSRASITARDATPLSSSRTIRSPTFFPRGVMASPDGRFVFEAVRAAKALLNIMTEIDAVEILRFIPSRFYLYGIYSAVFLYKAHIFGALTAKEEEDEVIGLVRGFYSALEKAATSEQHIGYRYGRLLKILWSRKVDGMSTNQPKRTGQNSIVAQSPRNTQPAVTNSNIPSNDQSTAMLKSSESSNTLDLDLFSTTFSNFDADILGLMPQTDFGNDALRDNSYMTARYLEQGFIPSEASLLGLNDMNVVPPFTDSYFIA